MASGGEVADCNQPTPSSHKCILVGWLVKLRPLLLPEIRNSPSVYGQLQVTQKCKEKKKKVLLEPVVALSVLG